MLRFEEYREKALRNLAILETMRRKGPISRMDISKLIGVNPVTVSHYIERFIEKDLVREKELDVSTGGRRPVLLDLNPEAGYAVGVGANLFGIAAVLIDMEGNVISRIKYEKEFLSPRNVVESITEIVMEIFTQNSSFVEKVKGIGIGIAGVIDKERDLVRWPQKIQDSYLYEYISFPLKDYMERKFNLPVVVENDATSACFAEYWLNLPQETKNIIYLFSGVGVGLFLNGEIYAGSSGCAGEPAIWCNISFPEERFSCEEGRPCFLRRWEQDLGITDEVKRRVKNGESSLLQEMGVSLEEVNLRKIFEAGYKGDILVNDVLERAGRMLGIKTSFLVNFLNPDIVIIGGGIEEAGPIFMGALQKTVKEWTFEEVSKNLKIIPSSLGEESIALGGASLIVRRVFANS